MKKGITYKQSGVDITKADRFVRSVSSLMKRGANSSVLLKKGSFGALYALSGNTKNTVLVSSTDGVGTKLLLAKQAGKHDTVGIDLVAMNVNDILCTGAKPLFFLDYIACGRLKPKLLTDVVRGIAKGCRMAGCRLIGGETAEMPDLYKQDEYDLAGFAVGVIDRRRIIDSSKIKKGDILIGLASSGIHSNGYSLVRKALSYAQLKKYLRQLLKPTRIYVKEVLAVLKKYDVKGIAHITGGSYYSKLAKIVPQGKCFAIRKGSWPVLKIFQIIQKTGKISDSEMYRTFNMGIGMVLVVSPHDARGVKGLLRKMKVRYYEIGKVTTARNKKIQFV